METADVLKELYGVVLDRKENFEEGSYTCYLFSKGLDKILKKCGEECSEMIIAAKNADNAELANEVCDLLYHILVLMAQRGLPLSEVEDILRRRSLKIGNLKQMRDTDRET
jgi:phosphoribosyl-ATP pyrophosphohydrolase